MLASSRPRTTLVCQHCREALRAFSTTSGRQALGPEHPRYINIPEPPQQTSYKPVDVKGVLPVPRPLFTGKRGVTALRRRSVRLATQAPIDGGVRFPENSWDKWKQNISAQRKRNLRQGTIELRLREQQSNRRRAEASRTKMAARATAVSRPEREDERLTTISNNFDLKSLMRGEVHAQTQSDAEQARLQYEKLQTKIKNERLGHVHTLFTKATKFIVSPQQLDEAIEQAFGTDEEPVLFGRNTGAPMSEAHSIWADGVPEDTRAIILRLRSQSYSERLDTGQDGKVQGGATIDQVAAAVTGGDLGVRRTSDAKISDIFAGLQNKGL